MFLDLSKLTRYISFRLGYWLGFRFWFRSQVFFTTINDGDYFFFKVIKKLLHIFINCFESREVVARPFCLHLCTCTVQIHWITTVAVIVVCLILGPETFSALFPILLHNYIWTQRLVCLRFQFCFCARMQTLPHTEVFIMNFSNSAPVLFFENFLQSPIALQLKFAKSQQQ